MRSPASSGSTAIDTRFQIGTDVTAEDVARRRRISASHRAKLSDRNSDQFQNMTDVFNISYDRFIRTSDDDHHRASQAIWTAIEKNGDIYKDVYSGWYSVRDEAYYDEAKRR